MKTFFSQLSGQAENRFYGHIHVLAQYCGFEGQPWLNGYLQHGWNATDGFGNYLGGKRVSNKFVWSKRCEGLIKNKGKSNVFTIGAPWIYLDDVYPQQQKQNQSGVVAYPAHSSSWSKMGDTNKEYAHFLKDKYGEVMVVLHRYDFENAETRRSYESFGHSVTTHGVGTPWQKGFDPLFLKNIRDLVSGFSTVVSNSMNKASQVGDGSINWNAEIMKTENQMNLWKTELGIDYKKTPQELRKILGWLPQPKKSASFFIRRSIDIISGSSKAVSLKVLKSTVSK